MNIIKRCKCNRFQHKKVYCSILVWCQSRHWKKQTNLLYVHMYVFGY